MNDVNSLPHVPQHTIDAMNREAEKKFGKVEETVQPAQLNPMLQHHEEPQFEEQQSIDSHENVESPSEDSGNDEHHDHSEAQTNKEYNFTAIREKARQAEKERDEAIKLLREMTAKSQKQPVQEEPEDTLGINPDDLVEGKHLSKVTKELAYMRRQLEESEKQNHMARTEAQLKNKYPDFDKVLTPDNIETFKMAYPELAATVGSTQDPYTALSSAYTMIKKFGVYQEPGTNMEKDMAKKNASKPRPVSTVAPQQGESPLSRANAFANGLTKELQEQLYKEMSQARKGY